MNSNDKKLLSQDLKKFKVEGTDAQRIAKGEISIKTLTKIYLIENINIRLRKPKDTIVLIIPSIENKVWLSSSITTIEFKILIRLEKQISVFKILLPSSLIEAEIRLFKDIICLQIKKLLFIQIPYKNKFYKKLIRILRLTNWKIRQ